MRTFAAALLLLTAIFLLATPTASAEVDCSEYHGNAFACNAAEGCTTSDLSCESGGERATAEMTVSRQPNKQTAVNIYLSSQQNSVVRYTVDQGTSTNEIASQTAAAINGHGPFAFSASALGNTIYLTAKQATNAYNGDQIKVDEEYTDGTTIDRDGEIFNTQPFSVSGGSDGDEIDGCPRCIPDELDETDDLSHKITLDLEAGDQETFACGTHWEIQEENRYTYTDVCGEVRGALADQENAFNFTWRCVPTEDGWNWTRTHQDMSHLLKQEELDQDLLRGHRQGANPLDVSGLAEMKEENTAIWERVLNQQEHYGYDTAQGAIACGANGAEAAVTKHTRTAKAFGKCADNQCYSSGYCWEQGTYMNRHLCQGTERGTSWISPATLLAQEMISLRSTDTYFRINCGDDTTVTNKKISDDLYCELAAYETRRADKPIQILTGTIFTRNTDVANRTYEDGLRIKLPQAFEQEILRLHPEFTINQTNPTAPYLTYATIQETQAAPKELAYAIITNEDSFGSASTSLWSRLLNLFSSAPETELPSTSASKLYWDNRNGQAAVMEYQPTEESTCPDRKIMLLDGANAESLTTEQGISCYHEATWRRFIQGR